MSRDSIPSRREIVSPELPRWYKLFCSKKRFPAFNKASTAFIGLSSYQSIEQNRRQAGGEYKYTPLHRAARHLSESGCGRKDPGNIFRRKFWGRVIFEFPG